MFRLLVNNLNFTLQFFCHVAILSLRKDLTKKTFMHQSSLQLTSVYPRKALQRIVFPLAPPIPVAITMNPGNTGFMII